MIEFYGYSKCNTSRQVENYIKQKGYDYKFIDITIKPPSKSLLSQILKSLQLKPKDLINPSSSTYKELNLKEQLKTMNDKELLELLLQHPKLIKRPIIIDKDNNKYSIGKDALSVF